MKKLWNELLWNFTATANVCIKYWCGDDVFGGEMRRKNLFASNICVQHLRKKYFYSCWYRQSPQAEAMPTTITLRQTMLTTVLNPLFRKNKGICLHIFGRRGNQCG